ncbi:MAG TPA: transcription factor S [Candidatus Nanoarchaeia archaeon]|nr:transcription factor S [Candidatus Nanoarchaeia archaeon]
MEFCPKCGSILVKKGKTLRCQQCGYSSRRDVNMKTSEKMPERKEVGVVKGKSKEVLPVVNAKCKECGNDRAYFWEVQTRASDESPTKFFKCTKCGTTWRDYK